MTTPQKLYGYETDGDKIVRMPMRDWDALRRALWRNKVGWEIATRAAEELIERCSHMTGCAGKDDYAEPCLVDCPDRELRMSALVILNAARQFAPVDARRPADAAYYAPSREYFSEVLSSLIAAQAEIEALRGANPEHAVVAPPPRLPPSP